MAHPITYPERFSTTLRETQEARENLCRAYTRRLSLWAEECDRLQTEPLASHEPAEQRRRALERAIVTRDSIAHTVDTVRRLAVV